MKTKLSLPGDISGEFQATQKELKTVANIFKSFIPGGIRDGVGIWNDNIRFKRWKNLVKISQEANKIIKDCGIKPQELPIGFETKFIEEASLQEEPTVQEMWSNLLANVSTGEVDSKIIYISILKELTITEVEILNMFFTYIIKRGISFANTTTINLFAVRKDLYKKYPEIDIAFDNLFRLKLIENPQVRSSTNLSFSIRSMGYGGATTSLNSSIHRGNMSPEVQRLVEYLEKEKEEEKRSKENICLTKLGWGLISACNEPIKNKNNV